MVFTSKSRDFIHVSKRSWVGGGIWSTQRRPPTFGKLTDKLFLIYNVFYFYFSNIILKNGMKLS